MHKRTHSEMASSPTTRPQVLGDIFKQAKVPETNGYGSQLVAKVAREVMKEVEAVPMSELLDADSRPSFILDLDPDIDIAINAEVLSPVFYNLSLRSYDSLRDIIAGEMGLIEGGFPDVIPYESFRAWAISVTPHDASRDVWPTTFLWCGLLWTGCTVKRRFRIISGNQCYNTDGVVAGDLAQGPPPELACGLRRSIQPTERTLAVKDAAHLSMLSNRTEAPSLPGTQHSSVVNKNSSLTSLEVITNAQYPISDRAVNIMSDWTVANPTGDLTEHIQFARSINWAATSLGAMETWSPELRQVANLVMLNPHPIALFYGDDLTMMYNEAYRDGIAGIKHPNLLGTGFQGPFSELWDDVSPLFAECRATGKPVAMVNQMLPMMRFGNGFLEETYFSWCFVPIFGGTSEIQGFYNAPYETTATILANRRTDTLRRIGEETSLARTVKDFWQAVLRGLEENKYDVPFALLYSVVDAVSDDGDISIASSGSAMGLKICVLEGCLGVPRGHDAAPESIDLKRSREGFVPAFRQAMRTREPSVLQARDGSLPESLLENIEWRGYPEPCREATIFPLRPTNGEMVLGFLLIGTNPRLPYNDAYQSFVNILNRQLATALASTILFEDELWRGHTAAEAAALERQHLAEQLDEQTRRWERMSELSSTVGLFILDADGVVLQANNTWYEIIELPRDQTAAMAWMSSFVTPSEVEKSWVALTVEKKAWSGELQLKRVWTDIEGNKQHAWVLAAAQPEFDADGTLKGVMGSLTDVSHLKWVESLQSLRLSEAEKQRQQQNNFIDITSHEMRNPLSAILQCADDVTSAMNGLQIHSDATPYITSTIIQDCKEAAETISFCAQHQKSIVDDILTISKLDSDLLVMTPAVVQPQALAQRACKMFEADAQKKGIKLTFATHETFQKLDIDCVTMDANRVMQILINLLTNAIKFTQSENREKLVTVKISAFSYPPEQGIERFTYVPTKLSLEALNKVTDKPEWGSGEPVFIGFVVEDTGRGLTSEEVKVLFQRFSQASPRTHAQYGGSGLGLFISRQLTELHGGRIGVASEYGVGSSFGFYVMSRRAASELGGDLDATLEPSLRQQDNRSGSDSLEAESPLARRKDDLRTRLEALEQATEPAAGQLRSLTEAVNENVWILVVEDNLVNQKVLRKQLEKLKYKVAVANHGKEALDHLEKTTRWKGNSNGQPLHLILMDLEMPVMNGETAARNIRQLELDGQLIGHVPIIAVSANVRMEQVSAARDAGMDDVVSKPFRIPELTAKIRDILPRLQA